MARSVPLSQIAERLEREGLLAGVRGGLLDEVNVDDLSSDSRQIGPGWLFCAVSGTTGDGHRFLPDVAAKGAAGATVERASEEVDLRQIQVTDGRLAASYAAAEFFGDPWNELALVGITGTNGKTTTAAILRHLLSTRMPAASIGTLGAVGPDGKVVEGTEGLTTPGPVDLARWLRGLADDGVRGVAMEVSSHALHQGRAAAARFDAALFTNLTRDHLDYHATMEEYREAKLGLVGLLKPGAAAVLNADDPAWDSVDAPRIVRFGIDRPADVRALDVRVGEGGMEWTLETPDGSAPVALPLFGGYNVANSLGAAAALWSMGWKADEIAAGLATLPQVPGRLERVVGPPDAVTTLVDYAHTPDALERALLAVRPLVRGRLIVVFGAGGDRDKGKRPEMGRVAAALADLAIVTSDNPRTEDPEAIADDIERGMGDAPRVRLTDRREAIAHALNEGGRDDLVLLAGKGHETYQIRGTEKLPFDEREVIRELLAGRKTFAAEREG
ncbi:MAG TPA: UDP-N-acetylmuramoyl-L-alanyl-D-glutamate--2,6-diaminopimelate ligase [Longimicrobiaceae bacterium]|jgi:UDP-N-acetylmuramoyl-L-alanyl-D-glutamate--2,6-diaminopimelate ligase|nr:UDP-N-acetylmuramoyl-L-alanyl-D-glutamate--2,6-diaminopimelate ligase [Longimicrobiaceae bacterium]